MNTLAHICIVSDRLLPNLIPILMDRPHIVFILASEEMQRKGIVKRFEKILQSLKIETQTHTDLPSTIYGDIASYASNYLNTVYNAADDLELVLNITGGNKLMTIAIIEVMRRVVSRIIYTDTFNDRLEILPEQNSEASTTIALESVIDVPFYLQAQGMVFRKSLCQDEDWKLNACNRKIATKYLGREAINLSDFMGAINRLANLALSSDGKSLNEQVQLFDTVPRGRWAKALNTLNQHTDLQWDQQRTIHFPSVDIARYIGGGWLEEFAWHQIRDLAPKDVRIGAEGTWENTQTGRNELDVVVTHNNRLLLIECKTLRLGRDEGKDRELLYKLDSVGDDVKGLFGEVVLLSARQLPNSIIDKAKHHRIKVIGPDKIKTFQQAVKTWMEKGRFPSI